MDRMVSLAVGRFDRRYVAFARIFVPQANSKAGWLAAVCWNDPSNFRAHKNWNLDPARVP